MAKGKRKGKKVPADPMAATAAAYAHLDCGGSPETGQARLAQLQDTLGRRFGRNTALALSVAPHARVRRMPWGILMMDWKTGGLVLGRVNRLWGRKSTLKTTLCLRALRQAQHRCRHCKGQIVRHPDCRCREIANYRMCLDRLARVVEAQGPIPECGTELAVEQARLEAKKARLEARYGKDVLGGTCPHRERVLAGEVAEPCMDCECPKPRWWLADDDDYAWLPSGAALELFYGRLPDGVVWKTVKNHGTDAAPQVPVLACKPPPHVEKGKPKDVVFTPMARCEPMRCIYVDSEGTIDAAWAEEQGVDLDLVLVVGNRWGEECLETIEEATLMQEFDFIVIDSTSVLEPQAELEKAISDKPRVAAKATLMGRWVSRHLAAMFDEGLTGRYRPTILCTSQVTMKGIGGGMRPWSGPTDGKRFEHALSLDIKMDERGYTFDKAGEHAIRGRFEFAVKKDKAGSSYGATGEINFWVRPEGDHPVGDSDDLATVMGYGRQLGGGFIEEGTGKRLLVLRSRYLPGGEMAFARVGDCTAFLRANPTVYDDLRGRVLRQLLAAEARLEVARAAEA